MVNATTSTEIPISIVICTHNRWLLLKNCLKSLADYTKDLRHVEVLVIDNASTDRTRQLCTEFSIQNFRYVFEGNLGLSAARNRGMREAQFDWIMYLDDDAIIYEDTLFEARRAIQKNWDVVAGVYEPYYIEKKPKWLSETLFTNISDFAGTTENLAELKGESISGGIFIVRKDLLLQLNGFDEGLGMKGRNLGFGEEVLFQRRAEKLGGRIGVNKNLRVGHYANPIKFRLTWHLSSQYRVGLISWKLRSQRATLRDSLFLLRKWPGRVLKQLISDTGMWWNKSDFYWQNIIVSTGGVMAYEWGRIVSSFKDRNKED